MPIITFSPGANFGDHPLQFVSKKFAQTVPTNRILHQIFREKDNDWKQITCKSLENFIIIETYKRLQKGIGLPGRAFQFPFCNSRRSTCVLAKKIMRDLIILCKNILVGPYLTLFSKRLLSWLIQVAYFDMIISHQKRRNLRLAKKVRKSLKKIMVFFRSSPKKWK